VPAQVAGDLLDVGEDGDRVGVALLPGHVAVRARSLPADAPIVSRAWVGCGCTYDGCGGTAIKATISSTSTTW
jgi:hypothetical protein